MTTQTVTLNINDLDEVAPTFTSGTTAADIDENSGPNQVIYDANATDPAADTGPSNPVAYSFGGGTDDAHFTIDADDGEVRLVANPNHEVKSSYSFNVTATDAAGNATTQTVTLAINDLNEVATDIGLSANTVAENDTSGPLIGIVGVADPDPGDDHTFTVDDVPSFEIVQISGQDWLKLKAGQSLNREAPLPEVNITATDLGGLQREESFFINVTNVNEQPTDIALSKTSVIEAISSGAVVGNVTVTDPDAGDDYTFAVSDARFEILTIGANDVLRLKIGQSLDFETEQQIAVVVTATDLGSLSRQETFNLTVIDVNEQPNGAGLQTVSMELGSTEFPLGIVPAVDPEDDPLTYTVSELPAAGTVLLNGVALVLNQQLTEAQLQSLVYNAPLVDGNGGGPEGFTLEFTFTDGVTPAQTLTVDLQVTDATNDSLFGDNAANRLDGAAGNDQLRGLNGADTLIGGIGNDFLNGGAGADALNGGEGNDSYIVDAAGDTIADTGGNDIVAALTSYTLQAGVAIESLRTAGQTTTGLINLTGNELDNSVEGNASINILDGGVGADTMRGYAGNDTYHVDNAGDRVFEAVSQGSDIVIASVSHALLAGQAVELLRTNNAAATTAINFTGNDFANVLEGNAGANTLNGKGAADTMTGFGGNDTYVVDHAADKVNEAAGGGSDIITASVNYILQAGVQVELMRTVNAAATTTIKLTGNEIANRLEGNAGANTLNAGGAADIMQGFAGNDIYHVDNALDSVLEVAGQGTDHVVASATYALQAGANVEVLRTVDIAASTDINLTGNDIGNSVQGNAGDNVLNGRAGNDPLTGNDGNDTFVFNTALNATTNVDTVADLSTTDDTIHLNNAIFTKLTDGALAAGSFKVGTAAADVNDYIIYNSTTGGLYYDSNGNAAGGSTLFARLSKGLALDSGDFLVV